MLRGKKKKRIVKTLSRPCDVSGFIVHVSISIVYIGFVMLGHESQGCYDRVVEGGINKKYLYTGRITNMRRRRVRFIVKPSCCRETPCNTFDNNM